MKDKKIKYVTLCFEIVTIISAVILLVCLFGGVYFVEFAKEKQNSVCKEWEAQWTKRDVTTEEIEFLKENGVKLSNRYAMAASARLPKDTQLHTYFLISIVYSDVWFYVGEKSFELDELRYVFYPESETKFAKTGYSTRRTIPIYDEDSEKYLTIIQVADSKENFITDKTITYGDKYGLMWNYISNNYLTFIANLTLIVLSFVSVIAVIGACIVVRKKNPILYLIIGIFNLALWSGTNAFIIELFLDNWHLMYDMLYLSDFIMPLAFMLYLNEVQDKRYDRLYFICEVIYVPTILTGILLYIINIYNLHDFFLKIMLLYIIQIVVILITMVIDIFNKNTQKYKYVLIGFVLMSVCGIIQLISYTVNNMQMKIQYLSIGVILLLLMCITETAKEILNTILEKTAAISASKAKSDILARMSHEIRTPINAILGMNEMILRTTKEEDSKQYAEDVRRATNNLLEIINEILDFSKIDSGKMELVPVEYNLENLLRDVSNMFRIRAEDKGLTFNTDIDKSLPTGLYGDDVKIRQILSNLLSNAVKYTNQGNVEFSVTGTICNDNAVLRFKVKDTGIGIKPDNMSKLFAEFERIEENQNRGVEGTGLGMSITIRLLQMMGSTLKVESVYGEGSEFYFDLEQKIINTESVGEFEQKRYQSQQENEQKKVLFAPEANILVVDDNKMNLKVFTSLLEESGMNIDEAESGEECLGLIRQKKYDMIFLDHMMPEMDGVETLHRLKELPESNCKNTPVIALTANVVNGARDFYMAEGFDDFLPKPFNPESLEQMLVEWMPKELISYDEKKASDVISCQCGAWKAPRKKGAG